MKTISKAELFKIKKEADEKASSLPKHYTREKKKVLKRAIIKGVTALASLGEEIGPSDVKPGDIIVHTFRTNLGNRYYPDTIDDVEFFTIPSENIEIKACPKSLSVSEKGEEWSYQTRLNFSKILAVAR